MSYYSKTIIIFLLLACFSCSDKQQTEEIRFVEAVADVNFLDNIFSHCPDQVTYTSDNYLLVVNGCKDTVLQVVNLTAGTEEWIARKGGGPNEIGMLFPAVAGGKFSLESGVMYWDPNKRRIFKLQLNNNQLTFEEQYDIPSNLLRNPEMAITEHGFITNLVEGGQNLQKVDFDGNRVFTTDFYPPINTAKTGITLNYLYYSNIDFQANNNILVSALTNFPFLILYDQNLNQINQIKTKDVNIIDFDPMSTKDAAHYYLQVIAGPQYIYALNYNGTITDFTNRVSEPIIEIFDYELKHVGNLKLDKGVRRISIDFENNVLYIHSWSAETPEDHAIGKVEIPKSLHHLF
jgi:hypothetical protein